MCILLILSDAPILSSHIEIFTHISHVYSCQFLIFVFSHGVCKSLKDKRHSSVVRVNASLSDYTEISLLEIDYSSQNPWHCTVHMKHIVHLCAFHGTPLLANGTNASKPKCPHNCKLTKIPTHV